MKQKKRNSGSKITSKNTSFMDAVFGLGLNESIKLDVETKPNGALKLKGFKVVRDSKKIRKSAKKPADTE